MVIGQPIEFAQLRSAFCLSFDLKERGCSRLQRIQRRTRRSKSSSSTSGSSAAQAHAIHAYALAHLGKPREAAQELEAALPVLLKARGIDDPVVRRAQGWLQAVHPQPAQTAQSAQTTSTAH